MSDDIRTTEGDEEETPTEETTPDAPAAVAPLMQLTLTGDDDDDDDSTTTTDEPQQLSLTERLEARTDDATLALSTEDAVSFHDFVVTLSKRAVAAMRRMTGAEFKLAEALANIRGTIIMPSGFPDWAADSTTYQMIAEEAKTEGFRDLTTDERRTLNQRLRTTMHRTTLEAAIRRWVAANVQDPNDTEEPKRTFEASGGDDDTNPAFVATIRKHYVSTANAKNPLDCPPKYQSPEEKAAAARARAEKLDPPNPRTVAFDGIEQLATCTFQWHSKGALKGVSDLVRRITDPSVGALENPAQIADDLGRMADLATYAVKYLNNAWGDDTTAAANARDRMLAALWGASDESGR